MSTLRFPARPAGSGFAFARPEVVASVASAAFIVLLAATALAGAMLLAAANAEAKPIGPLGIWRSSNGVVYAAPEIPESTNVQTAFGFGDFWDMDDPSDEGVTFQQWIQYACETWNAERFTGILRPPSEGGVVNVPSDTALFSPAWPPGMIQGAARFSRLSRIYGQIYGVNIDDFGGVDTAQVRDIRDALKGKYVDAAGVVHHDTPATTPQLKLFAVIYSGQVLPAQFRPLVDGINLWIYNQNYYYMNIDSYVNSFRSTYPGKEINCGIYVYNSDYHWMTPASIRYMYMHLLNRYDDGDINGIMLFAGHWIIIPNIPRSQWDAIHVPALLDSIYYPYLGQGEGRVYDRHGQPMDSAMVTCYAIGRVSGDVLVRSKKRTDAGGFYHFSAWAGNRTTDSTLYYVTAGKGGYSGDTVSGWVRRGGMTAMPDVFVNDVTAVGERSPGQLGSPGIPGVPGATLEASTPNPFTRGTTIRYTLLRSARVRLVVYRLDGSEVRVLFDGVQEPGSRSAVWDGRDRKGIRVPPGVYLYRIETDGVGSARKTIVLE